VSVPRLHAAPGIIAARIPLPVSGHTALLRQPTGVEDMLLAETARSDTGLALDLFTHLVCAEDGEPLDAAALSVTDLDAFVLGLRRVLLGDRIVADITCPAERCRARIDLSFAIGQYLAHHRPRSVPLRLGGWSVTAIADEPGWFHLTRQGAAASALSFRLPNGADQLAVEGRADAADALARRCLRPIGLPRRLRHSAEAAMEALAPSLAGELAGVCPECGAAVDAHFDPRRFCLQEMRDRARFVYGDIDVLAQRYHWTERAILSLPSPRRASYAELARQAISA
jgi:hypothetical protein